MTEPPSSQTARRWMMITALVIGPAIAAASEAFIMPLPNTGSMHDDFMAMINNRSPLLISALLEGIGFTMTLGGYAGVSRFVHARGGTLATIGSVLCLVGILGFGWASANGFAFHALAGMADHETAFAAAQAIVSDPASLVSSMLAFVGPVGVLLLLVGLFRAKIVPLWPTLIVAAAMLLNGVVGTVVATLTADLLLLAASTWVAISLRRLTIPSRVDRPRLPELGPVG